MRLSTIGLMLLLALLLAPLAVEAQQPGKVPRIGFIEAGSASVNRHFLDAFRQGLRELGWVDGQNMVIEDRWAEGQGARFPDLVAELLRRKVDVLVPSSVTGALAAKHATATVPIVCVGG
jgi:putative ABC transport system substrate-binding protein